MFVIKIGDKYLEHIIFENGKPVIKLSLGKYMLALKFHKKETAKAIIKIIGKGELELL